MRPRPKDLAGSCACSPFDAIIARIEALEQRAAAIVSSVEGIPPDGTGNVNLPNSSEIGDALYGRMDAFTMSSVAKAINDELNTLLTRIGGFDFAGTDGRITAATEAIEQIEAELESYEARITAVEDDIISINAHILAVENDYVQKVGDTMTGPLTIPDGTVGARNGQAINAKTAMADLDAYTHMVRTSGSQNIQGIKTFTSAAGLNARTNADYNNISLSSTTFYNTLSVLKQIGELSDRAWRIDSPYNTTIQNSVAFYCYAPRAAFGDTSENQMSVRLNLLANRQDGIAKITAVVVLPDGTTKSKTIAEFSGGDWL